MKIQIFIQIERSKYNNRRRVIIITKIDYK